ncbi:MAG: hypothetical protein KGI79_01460 [Patescibacteria group bacterium]|nr:hypothetical protein [Patescibacteria group bacterium]MDE2116525.1 hypothetical protein [Patescibacteria group bacterium]
MKDMKGQMTVGLMVALLGALVIGFVVITMETFSPAAAPMIGFEEPQIATTTSVVQAADATSPASPPSPSSPRPRATVSVPEHPDFRLCTANDLTGMADWQGATGALAGTLRVTDSASSACSLSHDDYMQIMSGDQVLPVGQIADGSVNSYTDLQPRDSVSLRFVWYNWCDGALQAPASVRLILPLGGGYLQVPVIDSNGTPLSDAPACGSPQTYSSLAIWQ